MLVRMNASNHTSTAPVLQSRYLNELTGAELFFNARISRGGAFKVRGACNAVFGLRVWRGRCRILRAIMLCLCPMQRGVVVFHAML